MWSAILLNYEHLAITFMTLTFFSREALVARALLYAVVLGVRALSM
jgi:hypothetical protein